MPACPAALQPWLIDQGSLTRRLQAHCQQFAVYPQFAGFARVSRDEAGLIGVPVRQCAYVREVWLQADGAAVVFAHSTCAPQQVRRAWAAVTGLGTRSLGSMLFAHPLIRREPLSFQVLRSHSVLYQRIARQHPLPAQVWARRSRFWLHGAPLLVTEVFLPGMTELIGG